MKVERYSPVFHESELKQDLNGNFNLRREHERGGSQTVLMFFSVWEMDCCPIPLPERKKMMKAKEETDSSRRRNQKLMAGKKLLPKVGEEFGDA